MSLGWGVGMPSTALYGISLLSGLGKNNNRDHLVGRINSKHEGSFRGVRRRDRYIILGWGLVCPGSRNQSIVRTHMMTILLSQCHIAVSTIWNGRKWTEGLSTTVTLTLDKKMNGKVCDVKAYSVFPYNA